MSFMKNLFKGKGKKTTASIAKERLQIIVSHERIKHEQEDYLPKLQQELLDVIAKYVKIDKDLIKVALERSGSNSTLELNVTIPEQEAAKAKEEKENIKQEDKATAVA